jgi:GTP-binding protein
VERCRVLVHLVEGANPEPGRSPAKDFAAINRELKLYSRELAAKPQVVAVTKVDLPEARAAGQRWSKARAARKSPVPVHLISAATNEGLDGLLDAVAGVLWADPGRRRSKPRKRPGKQRRAR